MYFFDTDITQKNAVSNGIKCRLKDLSDDGCAVLVGGKAEKTFKLILQFSIDKMQINMVGTVTKIEYNEDDNTSILHIQSDVMPLDIRNIIQCVGFGIIDDDIEISAPETAAGETEPTAAAEGQPLGDSPPPFDSNDLSKDYFD